jgi:3-oxoacyl-[acyl-carrier-protein] synthase-3
VSRRGVLRGVGGYLPERRVANHALSTFLDTDDQWIRERTGIAERRIADPRQTTATLATLAARDALDHAGMAGSDIDLIVLATATPDHTFPATATKVQAALGAGGAAFDIQAVCSGFVYALATADDALVRGRARAALVIGAETFSRILDWGDRGTAVLFGDGAGAVVLEAVEVGEVTPATGPGVLSTYLRSDGRQHDLLYVDGGPSTTGQAGALRMLGNQVFKQAVERIAEAMERCVAQAGVAMGDVDLVVPHQANRRILDAVARRVGVAPDRIVTTLDLHGNTSAASIPLALAAARDQKRLGPDQLVLVEAMGGGLTWGAALIRT